MTTDLFHRPQKLQSGEHQKEVLQGSTPQVVALGTVLHLDAFVSLSVQIGLHLRKLMHVNAGGPKRLTTK